MRSGTAAKSARAILTIGLICFGGGGCRASRVGPSSDGGTDTGASGHAGSNQATAAKKQLDGSDATSSVRHALLGRVVDLGEMKSVYTLADAPDEEVSDPPGDVAVLLSVDSRLSGFRLSTGKPLWTRTTEAPCRHLVLVEHEIYSGCGDTLYAFAEDTGEQSVIERGPGVGDPVVTGGGRIVASTHDGGRITLYRVGTHARLGSKVVPELERAFRRDVLPGPDDHGICTLGLFAVAGRLFYRAGCYDDGLRRQWTKSLPLKIASDNQYEVRQLGPRYLVLDDQNSEREPPLPSQPGPALLLRWEDGNVTVVHDQTFATIDDSSGERSLPAPEVFARTRELDSVSSNGAGFPRREAVVASDDQHSYAIIVNRAAGLVGVDRKTGRVLFLVPVSLGDTWSLELAAGHPVVRTRSVDSWRASIYSRTSGAVLYQDVRPRARGY